MKKERRLTLLFFCYSTVIIAVATNRKIRRSEASQCDSPTNYSAKAWLIFLLICSNLFSFSFTAFRS